MFGGTHAASDGSAVRAEFRAYAYAEEGVMYWDMTTVVETLFAYRKSVYVWAEIAKYRPMWQACCEELGLEWTNEFKACRRQCKSDNRQTAQEHTRSCQTVSTRLLAIALLCWGCTAKLEKTRERSRVMMKPWLECIATPEAVDLSEVGALVVDAAGCCAQAVAELGCCPHLSLAAVEAHMRGETPHGRMLAVLLFVFRLIAGGGVARFAILLLLDKLEHGVQFDADRIPAVEPHKLKVRRTKTGRALPAEDTYKAQNLRISLRSQEAKNGKGVMK